MLKASIKHQPKRTSQLSKMWTKCRQYRLTSSNIYRCVSNDPKFVCSLLPEYTLDGLDQYSLNEILVKIVYYDRILSTGLHIHKKFHWLGTSPDGLFPFGNQLIPVEIKSTHSEKTDQQIINENYYQLQVHCEVLNNDRVLVLIYRTNQAKIQSYFVFKDPAFVKVMIAKAEANYFRKIPEILCPNLSVVQIQKLIGDSSYRAKFLNTTTIDETKNSNQTQKIKKTLRWEKFNLNATSKDTMHRIEGPELLKRVLALNQVLFKKKYLEVFTDLFENSEKLCKRIRWEDFRVFMKNEKRIKAH